MLVVMRELFFDGLTNLYSSWPNQFKKKTIFISNSRNCDFINEKWESRESPKWYDPSSIFFFIVNLHLQHRNHVFHKTQSMYYRAKFYQIAEKRWFCVKTTSIPIDFLYFCNTANVFSCRPSSANLDAFSNREMQGYWHLTPFWIL